MNYLNLDEEGQVSNISLDKNLSKSIYCLDKHSCQQTTTLIARNKHLSVIKQAKS